MSTVKTGFEGIKAEKSSANVLLPGSEHYVRLMWSKLTNSFVDHKGVASEKDREWADPTPQVLVQFGSENGVMMHRFNKKGYKSFDEMDEKVIEAKNIVNAGGYAAILDEDDDKLRIEDPEKTEACSNILKDFMFKLAGPDGDGANVEKYIAEKNIVVMKLEKDSSAEGNGRTIVKYFREYSDQDVEQELETASSESLEG